jgi:hypothetical protein
VLLATFAGLIFVFLILSFSPMVPSYHSKYQIRNLKSIYTCSCDLKLLQNVSSFLKLGDQFLWCYSGLMMGSQERCILMMWRESSLGRRVFSGSYLLVFQFRLLVELNSGSEKV